MNDDVEPIPLLRPLPVDLEDLASAREGDPLYTGGVIDLETGEVWSQPVMDYAIETGEYEPEEFEDEKRWLIVDTMGSGGSFHDMVEFIDTVDDESMVRKLQFALSGKHPFRRFKDVLWDSSELSRWHDFSNEQMEGRASAWLAERGYRSTK